MKVVFRVDSSVQIGSGHLMRCLTLAECLREQGAEILFLCRDLAGNLCQIVSDKDFSILMLCSPQPSSDNLQWNNHAAWLGVSQQVDAAECVSLLQGRDVDWLIVDHYALEAEWECLLRPYVGNVMVIDDLADRSHDCDMLLDQNFYPGAESRYNTLVPKDCRQLIGPRYALLRSEFSDLREQSRFERCAVKKVLVFYGSSDLTNETGKAVRAIKSLGSEEVHFDVVVGASNKHAGELEKQCQNLKNVSFYVQVDNLAEMMVNADLCFGAGGTSTWERCCLGLPSIVTTVAANQEGLTRYCAERGLLYWLGSADGVGVDDLRSALQLFTTSPGENLKSISRNSMQVVDGKGTQRTALQIIRPEIKLRKATSEDCENVYLWRNSEETRKYIFDPEPILYETHCNWYSNIICSENSFLLIGECEGAPVGVLRYDCQGSEAIISVYLVPGTKGRGIGTEMIVQGSKWIRMNCPEVLSIKADILQINLASKRAFLNAGYQEHHSTYEKVLD